MTEQPSRALPGPATDRSIVVPTRLATASVVVATVLVLIQFGALVTSLLSNQPYRDAANAGTPVDGIFTAYDFFKVAFMLASLIALVVTCTWLGQIRANVEVARPGFQHRHSALWVWLGWWVPIVSFWFPYQIVRDLRTASLLTKRFDFSLLSWWWGWIGWLSLWGLSYELVPATGLADVGAVAALPLFEALATVAAVIAYREWIRLIVQLTAAQHTFAS